MIEDPIVREVREARDAYARRFNYDLGKICEDLRKRQKKAGRKVVRTPPKRPATSSAGG